MTTTHDKRSKHTRDVTHDSRGVHLQEERRRSANGPVTRWFGTNTDVDGELEVRQTKEGNAKLQTALDAARRLAAIVESSDDAIIGKDLSGVVTSWNPCAERVFGYKPEEMIGKSIRMIIPPEVFPDEDRIMSAVARGERTEHFETVRLRKQRRTHRSVADLVARV